MKTTIKLLTFTVIISGLFLSCVSWERTPEEKLNEPFTYVYDLPDMTQDEIYKHARIWVAETYNSAESVISFEDEESGMLKGNGIGELRPEGDLYSRQFLYNIGIYCKDNKSKIEFINIQPKSYYSGGNRVIGLDITWLYAYEEAKEYFDTIAESYRESFRHDISDW